MFPIWVFPSLCSLPAFSLPSFPSRSNQWCLWLTRVPSSPNLCIPLPPALPTVPCPLSLLTIMSLPSFPIDDYVPTLFSYFRLCSLFPSLFLIMPWHSLSLMSLCYFCKIVGNAIFDAVSAWVNGPDNYYLCTKLYSKVPHYLVQESPLEIMSARALLNNECSSPPK